ncbi:cobalt ECF transporter T component CbiQ [Clostridium peptidivorans]|uniref:cobalt ECF transporter T component CbiQ n=1 Tax=Clostridium peptidivorans TaxID=100174 RepID=UPI000BE3B9EC|nr:cobalt ECF transporter T component CbiQ [Clostridium peptidivorans]
MANITESIYNIHFLDELATKNTIIHKINPSIKLLVTIIYLVVVLSFGKYNIIGLLPYVFYPIIIFILSEVPFSPIFKKSLIVLPFVIGIGIFNPVFDTKTYIIISEIYISGGWISFASLMIKCSLTVLAGLLLIATTGIEKIALVLRKLFIPKIFVTQFVLTYRYISVLLEETAQVIKAYHLRAPRRKGVSFKVSGSLLGQILLRAFDRANRVYDAMILRGFNGEYFFSADSRLSIGSIAYLFLWVTFFLIARFFNIPEVLGKIIMGVIT